VPHIVLRGVQWFRGLSLPASRSTGPKLYGALGRVRRPGLWELPFGTPAREIVEEHAGGMQEGLTLKCWLPGGISTEFLLPQHLDLPMDFEPIAAAGSRLGTGLITVVEAGRSLLPLLRNMEAFFARESCGWCTPCRDGLPWTVKILAALERGAGAPGDIETLEQLTRLLGPGRTFCALAPGAMEPLQSALKHFRGELEAGIAPPRAPGAQHAA
jgi:NADH-quinone oxidoreductase subunit F